ncbi:hypothetical protein LL912_25030 [Niabella sp. CC-SYL272]|uniref:hypothetical protein n=1 Tax=Niabella agricola TaxID=2891571 RepID=UPI001F1DCBB6|nr:hypothetical protein [Niabella agricola]MCF3112076.1 hypothetical protein [Niabella agricola]
MRALIFLFFIGCFTLIACNHHRVQQQPVVNIPKALEDHSASHKLVSKRGPDELVESLYSELAEHDAGLKQLEAALDALDQSKEEAAGSFQQFDAKSQSYYKAADQHMNTISDSLLKDKIRKLVEEHLAKYKAITEKHQELLKAIDVKTTKLADLHTVLKVVKTLPVIETYQKDNRPGTASLESYSKKQDGAIEDINKMTH